MNSYRSENRKDLITVEILGRFHDPMNTEAQGITNVVRSSLNRAREDDQAYLQQLNSMPYALVEVLFTKMNQPWVMVSLSWCNTMLAFLRFPVCNFCKYTRSKQRFVVTECAHYDRIRKSCCYRKLLFHYIEK